MLSPRDQLIEDFGLFWEGYGLPRILGRMHGLLLISNEPHLSLEQIAEELQISKASASTIARQLQAMTMINKSTVPGDRRDYYRIADDNYIKSTQESLRGSLRLAAYIEQATKLEGLNPATRKRLRRMEHFYEALVTAIEAFFRDYRDPDEADLQPHSGQSPPGRATDAS